jgi:hypothetical protein
VVQHHVEARFLEDEEGTAAQERREGELHGPDRYGVEETRVQAAEHVHDLSLVVDGVAEVGELVGVLLEACEVAQDGHVALHQAAEVRADEDSLRLRVVEEERGDGTPHVRRRGRALVNKTEDFRRDAVVQP